MTVEFKDKDLEARYRQLANALFRNYNLQDIVRYLEEKTYLNGDRFSFKNHEFQETILSDTNAEVNVQKCAQVGMSEAMARYALGISKIIPYFSTILTMPHTNDIQKFCRTRIDPIIRASPDLDNAVNKALNNSEMKEIGNSMLYFKGTTGATTGLSVPADLLIHDEIDRSDPEKIGQYQSRLLHSKWKLTRRFSTPTMDKVGIAAAMDSSKRYRHMCKCDKCNHTFVPNYHDHVHIPDYNLDKQEISKHMLPMLRWQEAVLLCPKCGRAPSLQNEHMSWVLENTRDHYFANGYFVTPFSVPNTVTIPSLVHSSTKYGSWSEFRNQSLGETAHEDNQSMTVTDLEKSKFQGSLETAEVHCMGIDVGQICHILVGRLTQEGMLLVVHKERVRLGTMESRRFELMQKYRVIMTVIDSQPETSMVARMQAIDPNLWGAVYHKSTRLAVYDLVKVDENQTEGRLRINLAKIHDDLNFDQVMAMFKAGMVRWALQGNETDALFQAHALDMTRKLVMRRDTMVYGWEKSNQAQDHFWHTLGYLHVACRLAPTAAMTLPVMPQDLVRRISMPGKGQALPINPFQR